MISFINNTNTVEILVDISDIPPQYQPTYKKALIRKEDVSRISLDMTNNYVFVFLTGGEWYSMTYQFIDSSYNCTNNDELYDLFKSFITL